MTATINNTDEARIRAVLDDQLRAVAERDPERAVAVYSADVVLYNLAPPLAHYGADARDAVAVRAWMATFDGPIRSEVRELKVTVHGDIAFCHGLRSMTATPAGSTESFTMWFRTTTCLRRIDGEWKITHEHESTPFYMDGSFLAATDLLP